MAKSDFLVMQQMSDENKDIRMTPHFVSANLAKGGGHVTMGVDAQVIHDLMSGKYSVALYIINLDQFFEIKEAKCDDAETQTQTDSQ